MKIMLIATIRGKNEVKEALTVIIDTLKKDGQKVYHEHLTSKSQSDLDSLSKEENLKFHKSILAQIKRSDIVVVECSYQSLSVGYLISYAAELNKPVVMLHKENTTGPNLFPTLTENGKLFIATYPNLEELPKIIAQHIEFAKDQQDTRFNFFVSPRHVNYLDWIAKTRKLPRSVYLRKLIEKEIENDEEYLSH